METVKTKTPRGFSSFTFTDRSGAECSLQKSSIATENAIWFGCNNADPKIMVEGSGWESYHIPEGVLLNTRMHLTQEQVRELLPALQQFAETGELTE